jgi:hypothetical protein
MHEVALDVITGATEYFLVTLNAAEKCRKLGVGVERQCWVLHT